jgi:hypothetical protein
MADQETAGMLGRLGLGEYGLLDVRLPCHGEFLPWKEG